MAIIKSAKKRIKSSKNKRVFNLRRLRVMREESKKFLKEIIKKDTGSAEKMLPNLFKSIDKAAKNGVIKKNTASRNKSRFSKQVADLKK